MVKAFGTPLRGSYAFRCTHDRREWDAFDPFSPLWALTDPGPVWGAFLVERFRTLGGHALHLQEHRERVRQGAVFCGWSADDLLHSFDSLIGVLLDANRELIQQAGDASVVCLFSPFEAGWQSHGYLLPVPFAKLHHWYHAGASLCSVDISAPTSSGVPSAIKHRSRFAYWAADQRADKQEPGANALLFTTNGYVADTSSANVAVWNPETGWRTPLDCECHPGSTLAKTQRLLSKTGETITKESLTLNDLLQADAVALIGSTGLIWPARTLDGKSLGTGLGMSKLQELTGRWIEFANVDFVSQAEFWVHRGSKKPQ